MTGAKGIEEITSYNFPKMRNLNKNNTKQQWKS